MNYLRSKKFRLLLAMLSFLTLISVVQDTYAKYISSASANSTFSIAQWTFKVNEQDVLTESDFSATIVPVIDNNPNIREGYIAPTSTGYFDIIIDYSNVGVSFNEELILIPGSETLTDLIITGYTHNGGEVIPFNGSSYAINIDHTLGEIVDKDIYRFYVKWIDGDGESMDNAADTNASKEESANVGINLKFTQLAN